MAGNIEEDRLDTRIQQTSEIAHEMGLRPGQVNFIVAPAAIVYEGGAYGLPGSFSHWTKGRDYFRMKNSYDHGLSKIYELVFNTDPAIAFLLDSNSTLVNTTVAAHVLAHVDFFAHNPSFTPTNRKMIETASLAAERIDQYRFKFGDNEVEDFLDAALSIEWYFDRYNFQRPDAERYLLMNRQDFDAAQRKRLIKATEYDDLLELGEQKGSNPKSRVPFPFEEEPDLLYFIAQFSPSPLEDWQKDCMGIIRAQNQYFLPQIRTKIMNEGWATFWHTRIMRKMGELGYISDQESLDFATMHSGVVATSPNQINPYQLGWKVWEDIDRRSKGIPRAGAKKVSNWWGGQVEESSLPDDIFDIRAYTTTDSAFLANYLTPPVIEENGLYIYGLRDNKWVILEKDPEKVKAQLIAGINFDISLPNIAVAQGGGDYKGNRELYLRHHRGTEDLDLDWASRTLRYVYQLWGRPVHLETANEKQQILLNCSTGKDVSKEVSS